MTMLDGAWRSIWLRTALIASVALAAALAAVVFTVYELTLVTERRNLDTVLIDEGDALAQMIVDELATSATVSLEDLVSIANRSLAANPGSSQHLSLVRIGDRVVSSARGPEPLEALRDDGLLPSSPPGMLISVTGVRSRSVEIVTSNLTLTVETLGDDAAITDEARDVAARTFIAALIGGVVGVIGIAVAVYRSTRGIGRVASTVRNTRLEDLSQRVPEPSGSNEVAVLARDVNAMLDELAAARTAKDELIALVSHELRTPLAAAIGHTELLAASMAPAVNNSVLHIERELGRLARLVDDLLALSRAADPKWLARRLVSVQDIVDELRHRLPVLGAERVDVHEAPDILVDVDQDRIMQALSNLVSNAVAHTPEATRIDVRVAVEPAAVVFEVTDDGPGIPPEVLERAGQAFVRGSRTGTGLGLAVCRAVTIAHGGEFEIDSGPAGTTARLRLPID